MENVCEQSVPFDRHAPSPPRLQQGHGVACPLKRSCMLAKTVTKQQSHACQGGQISEIRRPETSTVLQMNRPSAPQVQEGSRLHSGLEHNHLPFLGNASFDILGLFKLLFDGQTQGMELWNDVLEHGRPVPVLPAVVLGPFLA